MCASVASEKLLLCSCERVRGGAIRRARATSCTAHSFPAHLNVYFFPVDESPRAQVELGDAELVHAHSCRRPAELSLKNMCDEEKATVGHV